MPTLDEIAAAAKALDAEDISVYDRIVYDPLTNKLYRTKWRPMKEKVINVLIKVLMDFLTPDLIEKSLNSALDVIEEAVKNTDNEYDDRIIMPIIQTIREIME